MRDVKLYSYQQETFDRFKDKEYSGILLPTGCGKSITALSIAEYKDRPTLIIAPTSSLCMQWEDEVNRLMEGSICYRIDSKKKNTKKAKEAFKEFLDA